MTIAIITAFCYSVAELYKLTTWNTRFIPVMCALIGTVLGTLGYYFVPEFPGADLLESLIIGLASGLAATGTHESVQCTVHRAQGRVSAQGTGHSAK